MGLIISRMVCAKCGSFHGVGMMEEMSGDKVVSRHVWCDRCNIDLLLELKSYDPVTDMLIQ